LNAAFIAALVAAAVSLKAPLEDAAKQFDAASPGEDITFTFGSSGQIAAQIEQGAPVDLFVSASSVEVERLEGSGRIDPGTRAVLAGNRLVVVVPGGPPARSLAASSTRGSGVSRSETSRPFRPVATRGKRSSRRIFSPASRRGSSTRRTCSRWSTSSRARRRTRDSSMRPTFRSRATRSTSRSRFRRGCTRPSSPRRRLCRTRGVRARAFLAYLTSCKGRSLFVEHGFTEPTVPATK
jgi:hypothetical protein